MAFEDCSICHGAVIKGQLGAKVSCPGAHTYHFKCITSWFKLHSRCPLCNVTIASIDSHKKLKSN